MGLQGRVLGQSPPEFWSTNSWLVSSVRRLDHRLKRFKAGLTLNSPIPRTESERPLVGSSTGWTGQSQFSKWWFLLWLQVENEVEMKSIILKVNFFKGEGFFYAISSFGKFCNLPEILRHHLNRLCKICFRSSIKTWCPFLNDFLFYFICY